MSVWIETRPAEPAPGWLEPAVAALADPVLDCVPLLSDGGDHTGGS